VATAQIKQGAVVWVVVADPRGHRKRRPVVIVSSSDDIAKGHKIVAVAITTTFPDPAPPNHFDLPWDPTGRAGTGLRRRSAAVCNWPVAFHSEDVEAVVGAVPAATLLLILRCLPSAP
jgi:mRNA-degrading endonuclease toxin of MazEF toxin-antitoxin module